MSIKCECKLNNEVEFYEFDKVARQSNGAVLFSKGKAVILATVVSEFDNQTDEDFMPLTVQYIEKTYASAKFAGGFIKREGKPSDFETLTSRIIDRSLRPLFPNNYNYPTTITVIVLSNDSDIDLQVMALNAANAALYTSDIPIVQSVSAVRIGKIEDEYIINPTSQLLDQSDMDLFVAGTLEELIMIEMKSTTTKNISEDELINSIQVATNYLNNSNSVYKQEFQKALKEKVQIKIEIDNINEDIKQYVRDNYSQHIQKAIKKLAKSERSVALKDVVSLIFNNEYCKAENIELEQLKEAVLVVKRELVRSMIVNDNLRADGRTLTEIRPISIETNILPSAHSSCLFTRGETQALVVGTLGDQKDGQMFEMLGEKFSKTENFMVHYNFPGFSVGEAKPIFGVSRRELGHGNLAKRALESSINNDFKDTIRLVSEILESNGSSSMATVCGGSLALKAAGVPVHNLIAGIAMGAIFEDDKYAILSDIMGLEDHDGDLDFKVAGTKDGITALQMDIKLGGIDLNILKEALYQAKEGRLHILNLMEQASKEIIPSNALPIVNQFTIDTSKIMAVIGKAGSVIKEIIEKFEVGIDIDKESGNVKVSGKDQLKVDNATDHIKTISANAKAFVKKEAIDFEKLYKLDDILEGKIVRLADFGAFVELPKGGEGLLHISKISKQRVSNINDVCSVGQVLEIKVLKVSNTRIELGAV